MSDTDTISAGELRRLGVEIADDIPDIATIPRYALVPRGCESKHDEASGTVHFTITFDVVAPFKWVRLEATLGATPEAVLEDGVIIREWDMPPAEDIELEPVEGFTSMRVYLEPGFKAFCREGTIRASDVIDAAGNPVFDDARFDGEHGVLYFVDQFPEANWAHSCVYILVLVP